MHQYPNMFSILTAGSAGSYNLTSLYDVVARLISHVIAEASRQAADPDRLVIEASRDGEDRYNEEVKKRALGYSALSICTPTYFTAEGDTLKQPKTEDEAKLKAKRAGWGTGIVDYQRMTEAYMDRAENKLEGFDLRIV